MTVGIAPTPGDGFELINGNWAQALAGGQNGNVQTVVAHAGGLQPSAIKIAPNAEMVLISTVGSAADSVGLPRAKKGLLKLVLNGTATSADVYAYPGSTDTINGVATGTAYVLAGAKAALFFCPKDGIWGAILTA